MTAHASDLSGAATTRLARLDGLRGLAACGVAFGYHGANMLAPAGLPNELWLAPLAWLRSWGWTLVDLFFVLSGYIFAHVYLTAGSLTRPGGMADFAVARIARLWPLHLVLLLAMALIDFANPANTPGAFVAHLAIVAVDGLQNAFARSQRNIHLAVEDELQLVKRLKILGIFFGPKRLKIDEITWEPLHVHPPHSGPSFSAG